MPLRLTDIKADFIISMSEQTGMIIITDTDCLKVFQLFLIIEEDHTWHENH